MNPSRQVERKRFRIGLLGLAALSGLIEGCAGWHRREETADTTPAYLSRFPTLGSDLRSVPRGASIPPSGLGVDLVGGWQGKMAKMVDDAVGQVAAPGFANIR